MGMRDQEIPAKFTGKCNVFMERGREGYKIYTKNNDSAVETERKALSFLMTW